MLFANYTLFIQALLITLVKMMVIHAICLNYFYKL